MAKDLKQDTRLIHYGRGEPRIEGSVNVPVHRASTILSPDLESYLTRFDGDRRFERVTYGATGTQNAHALASVTAALEGGDKSVITASGLSAVTMAISTLTASGDHVLVTDSVYGPTRRFCNNVLTRNGVETTYYDPAIGAEIESLLRENTRLIYLEAPGSLTFEMQDIPAIVSVAQRHGIVTAMDNTWATPLYFQPLAHGVDVSIQAGTKYIAGHSDLVIGVITARDLKLQRNIADHVMTWGDVAGPDDCYLALRGIRTMAVRLRQQYESALQVAEWLAQREEVERVMYPPLPSDPGHQLWQRDFTGGASLFGFTLHTSDQQAIARMVDRLKLFSIGSSWGGYESLIAVNKTPLQRELLRWTDTAYLLRIHIGLEDPQDLIEDLEAGLHRL